MQSVPSKQKIMYQFMYHNQFMYHTTCSVVKSNAMRCMQRYKTSFSPSLSGYVFSKISCVPGLAGIELMFFSAAGMALCFSFVTKTVLITYWCSSYCWTASRPCLFLIVSPQWIDWGWARGWEGTQPVRWPELFDEIFRAI